MMESPSWSSSRSARSATGCTGIKSAIVSPTGVIFRSPSGLIYPGSISVVTTPSVRTAIGRSRNAMPGLKAVKLASLKAANGVSNDH